MTAETYYRCNICNTVHDSFIHNDNNPFMGYEGVDGVFTTDLDPEQDLHMCLECRVKMLTALKRLREIEVLADE